MADTNKKIKVKNRSSSLVVYRIEEENLRREFAPGEEKIIPFKEIEKLTFQRGGREILENFLQIIDVEVTDDLNIKAEDEYYMSEEQIQDLMKNGTLDAFLDCLDFAPQGIIDLIKNYAISLPLTDLNKANALKEKTGFDTMKALENLKAEKVEEETPAAAQPARRTTSKYKVISQSK